jgi:hypothetical protein
MAVPVGPSFRSVGAATRRSYAAAGDREVRPGCTGETKKTSMNRPGIEPGLSDGKTNVCLPGSLITSQNGALTQMYGPGPVRVVGSHSQHMGAEV